MSCACSRTSWHTFLRGLAQVHCVEAGRPLLPSLSSRIPSRSSRLSAPVQGRRSFHGTRSLANEAAAATEIDDQQGLHVQKEGHLGRLSGAAASHQTRPRKSAVSQRNGKPNYALEESQDGTHHQEWRASTTASDKVSAPRRQSRTSAASKNRPDPSTRSDAIKDRPDWRVQKDALKAKFPEGWRPKKRLSPDALAGIRALNAQFPDIYTTEALASKFEVPAEAIRRILKSKWTPNVEEERERQERWERRGQSVWSRKAELGIKPPKKWRDMGISRDSEWHEWRSRRAEREKQWEEEEEVKYRRFLSAEQEDADPEVSQADGRNGRRW